MYWEKQLVHQEIQGNIGCLLLEYVVKCKATLTFQSWAASYGNKWIGTEIITHSLFWYLGQGDIELLTQ